MDIEKILSSLIYFIVPGIFTMAGFLIKNIITRLESVENKVVDRPTEQDVRVIINDKIEPIREDIKEIKDLLYKMIHKLH